jgi:hypothetical protein
MHAHYSTVSQEEMNKAVAAIIDLAGYREAMGSRASHCMASNAFMAPSR